MPRKRKQGPPTGLTLSRAKAFLSVLQAGNYITTACEFVGISKEAHYKWCRRGEDEIDRLEAEGHATEELFASYTGTDGTVDKAGIDYMWATRHPLVKDDEWVFVVYALQVARHRAGAEIRALDKITSAMGEHWQAAAWFLERSYPDKYGRRQRINLEGPTEGSTPALSVSVGDLEESIKEAIRATRRGPDK